MSSWKSYGGINNYENTNNITVDHLSANYFTLKNEYVGYFSICGELSVSDDTYLRSNVFVGGNHVISRESTVNGNSFNKKNVDIRGNLGVGKNVDISGDTIMWGNLHLMQNYELEGNLMVNGNMIQMGLVSRNPKVYNINLSSVEKKLGFNNSTPTHTFDIKSDQIDGFSIQSIKTSNKNIIAQNNTGRGIVVKTDISNSSLNFFNDNSIENGVSDASITYSIGGNVVVKNSNNTLLNSKVSVSNRNVGNHSSHNETVVIYDISSGKYLYDVYENTVFSTGSALTLITDSSYSNTGLNIMTPTGKGIKIVGGSEITDLNRSSGIIGMLDVSNNLVPSLSLISGSSKIKKRSSMGINKCTPSVDNYVLDVNGPTKISHSEIVMVANTMYEIKKTVFSKTNRYNGFAFGTPVSTINGTVYSYRQVLLYTHDGGIKWNETLFAYPIPEQSIVLQSGCTSGDSVGFVAGEKSLLMFSTDAFITWNIITYSTPLDTTVINIKNINISSEIVSGATVHTLLVFYTSESISTPNKQRIGYFTFTSLIESYLVRSGGHILEVYPYSFSLSGLPNLLETNASYVDSSVVLIAGNSGIGSLTRAVVLSVPTLSFNRSHGGNYTYNGMSQFGNTVIAVGGNIISVSNDKGGNWTDVTTNVTLNDVYVNSLTTAISVGNGGSVYSTTNSGLSWNTVDQTIINSGIGNLILNTNRNLASINMIDDKTFIISSTIKKYSIVGNIPQPAESKIYNCHFPEIFDSINNNVLDVCGNMRLSGDSSVYGNSYVSKTITANNVKTEFIDYVGNNISIGTLSGGKTIRISDATTATSSIPNNIFIGGRHDNVVIEGNNVSVIGTIATQQATIQLLTNNTGGTGAVGTSAGAGINIRDFNDNLSAYIHVNQNLDGFVFKSSKIHPNVLNLRVDDLSIKSRLDRITNQQIHNGIVILRDIADNNSGNVTTMTTAWFDASNVLLCDYMFQGVTPNQQTVTTDFGVSGNVIFYKDLTINSNILIKNTLNVSNIVVSKNSIMIGTIDLSNNSETSLNVRGGGNFSGNLNLSGNLNMGTGSTIITGNLYQKSRTFLTGTFDAYDLNSGALQVSGGVSTKGNVFIGSNLNVSGNSTFSKIVNITNTSDATDYLTGTFIVDGGASIKKNVFILGNLEIKNGLRVKDATDVSGINIASVILNGGCVVSKQLYCEGNIITNGNISVYNDVVVGEKNLIQVIPLSVPFTDNSITVVGQNITGTNNDGKYFISTGETSAAIPLYHEVFNSDATSFNSWVGSGYRDDGLFVRLDSKFNMKIDGSITTANYLQIQLPSKFVITSYVLYSQLNFPKSWILCGSNDGINFDSLDNRTDYPDFLLPITFKRNLADCTKSYSYYRIVVTKTKNVVNNTTTTIRRFSLNGFSVNSSTPLISIGSTSILGNLNIGGVSRLNDLTESTNRVSGALVVYGGIGVSGNAFMGNINLVNGNVANNLVVTNFVGIGGVLSSSYTLDVSGSTNIRGVLSVGGSIDVSGQFTLGNIILTNTTETSQLGQGALVSFGGASITGNLFCGGNIVTNKNLTVSGNTTVKGTLHSNIRSNNIVVEDNGNLTVGVGGNFICLGTFNIAQSRLTSDIQSSDIYSGTLVIKGGAGISANVNVGGNLTVIGCTIVKEFICSGNSMTTGFVLCGNLLDSSNLSSGSLQVSGGSSIKGNLYVGGNIILSKQILVRSNISSNIVGEGSLIVAGGASISENCNIGGNTIIFGSTNNTPTIFFPPSTPPTTTLFQLEPTPTAVSVTTNVNQQTTTTLTGQTYLNSYQNGTYYITTGYSASNDTIIPRTYYGYYAVISGYSYPWISTRTYLNSTGRTASDPTVDTFITNYTNANNITSGEWLQYSLPYSLTLQSYDLTFNTVVADSTVPLGSRVGEVIESYPTSWIIAGSNDGVTWTFITKITNYFDNLDVQLPSDVAKTNFSVSANIGYSHLRFIIRKTVTVEYTPATGGANIPGLYNISFNGIPAISPVTNVSTQTTSVLNSNVTVNPTTNHITYNTVSSSVMNTLVGAGTFAGKSSLVVFGDSTVYGTHNIFDDLNIIGNINNPTNYLNINSNVIVNGNLKANISCSFGYVSARYIESTGVLTGATGSFDNIRCYSITGATGSFDILTGSTGSFNNLRCSSITGATGSFDILTGSTGSFNNLRCSSITGATGSFNILTGSTGSFNNLRCSSITGATGSFNILTGSTGSFNNLRCSNITGATGSFNILTGSTGSFNYLKVGNMIATDTISGPTGSFNDLKCSGYLDGNIASFNKVNIGTGNFDSVTGSTGSFKGLTGSTGSFNYLSAITFTSTSDYRIKGNVTTLDHSFNVDKLRPVTYVNHLSNKQDIGLIAHELQEEYPFLVNGEKDGGETQSVNYTGIIGILINEIKLLKKRVSTLEEQ
jgi:hypothetical protein